MGGAGESGCSGAEAPGESKESQKPGSCLGWRQGVALSSRRDLRVRFWVLEHGL